MPRVDTGEAGAGKEDDDTEESASVGSVPEETHVSLTVSGFPSASTKEGRDASTMAAWGFFSTLRDGGAFIGASLKGKGPLAATLGTLGSYTATVGHTLGETRSEGKLREVLDVGTILHDPLFRSFLSKCVSPAPSSIFPPGSLFGLRVYKTYSLKTENQADSGQYFYEIIKKISKDPTLHLHVGELGGPSLLDYPHDSDGGENLVSRLAQVNDAEELRVLTARVQLEPWIMWEHLGGYRKGVLDHDKFGGSAKKFCGTPVKNFPEYCKSIQNAAQTPLDSKTPVDPGDFAQFLREEGYGCPPGFPWGPISTIGLLLRQDDGLRERVELAYQLLARCCAHGLFFVEGSPSSKYHPISDNPTLRYPYRWRAVGRGTEPRREDDKEIPPLWAIGERLDKVLEDIKTVLKSTSLPPLEQAWEDFLDVHAAPLLNDGSLEFQVASVKYTSSQVDPDLDSLAGRHGMTGDKLRKNGGYDELPDFTKQLAAKKLGGSAGAQVYPWLFFVRPILKRAMKATGVSLKHYEAYKFASYRYLMNYIGGQLVHFRESALTGGGVNFDKLKEDPVGLLRFNLEMAYILSCWFHRNTPLAQRDILKVIEEVGDLILRGPSMRADHQTFEDIVDEVAGYCGHEVVGIIASLRSHFFEKPPPEYASFAAWLPYGLQEALNLQEWPSFWFYLMMWYADKGRGAVKVGRVDITKLFEELAVDPRIDGEMKVAGRILSILSFLFRSSGVYVKPSFGDYLDPDAGVEAIKTLIEKQRDARAGSVLKVAGGKRRVRAVSPREMLEELGKIHVGAAMDGVPTRFEVNPDGPHTKEERVKVRVPGTREWVELDKYVHAAVSGRLNTKLAHYILNLGDAMRESFTRVRKRVAEGESPEEKEKEGEKETEKESVWGAKGLSRLNGVGDVTARRSENDELDNQRYFSLLCKQLSATESIPELATWVFTAIISGYAKGSLSDLDADAAELIGRRLRNRFDRAGKERLGEVMNRKDLPNRIDLLQKALGAKKQSKRKHVALLPYLDPRLYEGLRDEGGIRSRLESFGVISSKDTEWVSKFVGQLLNGKVANVQLNNLKKAYEEFEKRYPSIISIDALIPSTPALPAPSGVNPPKSGASLAVPVAPLVEAKPSPPETEQGVASLEGLVLAVLRSLALYYERRTITSRKDKSRARIYNALRVKFLRAAYIQQFINEAGGSPAHKNLLRKENIPFTGLAAPFTCNTLPPNKRIMKQCGGYCSSLIGNYVVLLASAAPWDLEFEDNLVKTLVGSKATPFSSPRLTNFHVVGHKLYHVLGTIATFKPTTDNILKFISGAKDAWNNRHGILLPRFDGGESPGEEAEVTGGEEVTEGGEDQEEELEGEEEEVTEGEEVIEEEGGEEDETAEREETPEVRELLDKLARDVPDPFTELGPVVSLDPPRKVSFKRTPLPLRFNAGTGEFGKIAGFPTLLEQIAPPEKGGSPSGKKKPPTPLNSILFTLKAKPLKPDDILVKKYKYLPEVDIPIPEVIARAVGNRQDAHWNRQHDELQTMINDAEDGGETLRANEIKLKKLLMGPDAIQRRRQVIALHLERVAYLNAPRAPKVGFGGDIQKIKSALVKLKDEVTDRLLTDEEDRAFSELSGEEEQFLVDLYASDFVPLLDTRASCRKALGDTGFDLHLVDSVLQKIRTAPPETGIIYWRVRVNERLGRPDAPEIVLEDYINAWWAQKDLAIVVKGKVSQSIQRDLYTEWINRLQQWFAGGAGGYVAAGDAKVRAHLQSFIADIVRGGPPVPSGSTPALPPPPAIGKGITVSSASVPSGEAIRIAFIHDAASKFLEELEIAIEGMGQHVSSYYRERDYFRSRLLEDSDLVSPKRKLIRFALRKAWDVAISIKVFHEYYYGQELLCEWRVSKNLLRLLRNNRGKARVALAGFQIMPPQYPAKHPVANLVINMTKDEAMARVPQFVGDVTGVRGVSKPTAKEPVEAAAGVARVDSSQDGDVGKLEEVIAKVLATKQSGLLLLKRGTFILGYDLNQFRSRRTFAPAVVMWDGDDFQYRLSFGTRPEADFPQDTDRAIQGIAVGGNAGDPPNYRPWQKYFEKVTAAVLNDDHRERAPDLLTRPTNQQPYHREGEGIKPVGFLDKYAAVEFYRAVQATHAGYKAIATRRKRRLLRGVARKAAGVTRDPANESEAPAGRPEAGRSCEKLDPTDGQRLRRLAQAEALEARSTRLREVSMEAQARKLFYCVVTFKPNGVAYEGITFSALGIPGMLGKIRAKMPKDFNDFRKKVMIWLKMVKKEVAKGGRNVEDIDWKPVSAPKTSTRCRTHQSEGGEVDERFSVDYAPCSIGHILDRHLNAAENIALAHPIFQRKTAMDVYGREVDDDLTI